MSAMPRYYLRIDQGKYSGASDCPFDAEDDAAARREMIEVWGDLAGGVCCGLKENAEWHMEVLDESRRPLFRMRLSMESTI